MDAYLMLDVGGTNIKAGVLDEKGALYGGQIDSFDAKARGTKEDIFQNFARVLCFLREKISAGAPSGEKNMRESVRIKGIGMAFPGPFDYERGVSLMRGLNKYDSIYGVCISQEIKKYLAGFWLSEEEEQACRFLFLHDVEAFALGECYFGGAKGSRRIMFLCMGTGAGSAFAENKRILKGGEGQAPPMGWIFNTPFKESIIDDYLSVRGLETISHKVFGQAKSGLELFKLCGENNQEAFAVYEEFGGWLREAMLPFLESFRPDAFVLGGQLSKSFCYFGKAFEKECRERKIKIYLSKDTSGRALEGLYVKMQEALEEFGN